MSPEGQFAVSPDILLKDFDEDQWHAILSLIDAFTLEEDEEADDHSTPFPVRVVYVSRPERPG